MLQPDSVLQATLGLTPKDRVYRVAVTGGEVTLKGAPSAHLGAFLDVLAKVGVELGADADRIMVRGTPPGSGAYLAAHIETAAYPGLATDLQPPTAVLLTQARGRSRVHETIYEDRLEWLSDLRSMGARVSVEGRQRKRVGVFCF